MHGLSFQATIIGDQSMLHSLQEQSSFYYLVVLQLRLLGHVGVNTITNVEDNSILLKLHS